MEKSLSSIIRCALYLLVILILTDNQAFSQAREGGFSTHQQRNTKKSSKFDPEKLVIGGGLGAQFGTITSVQLAPTVGYFFTDNFIAGVAGKYIYYEEKYTNYTYKTNMYGGGVYSQYFFLEYFLAHVEYELLNLDAYNYIDNSKKRVNVNSFFVGGGLRSSIGGNSYASILFLYNLNEDIYSPYINPIFRISFGIGL